MRGFDGVQIDVGPMMIKISAGETKKKMVSC